MSRLLSKKILPSSFIRKWPRERRAQRRPDEYTETITVRTDAAMYPQEAGYVAAEMLARQIQLLRRKGYSCKRGTQTITWDSSTDERVLVVPVTFKKMPKNP